jgi:hypothetical protein
VKRYRVFHYQESSTGNWSKQIQDRHSSKTPNIDAAKLVCTTEHDTLEEAQRARPRGEFLGPLKL